MGKVRVVSRSSVPFRVYGRREAVRVPRKDVVRIKPPNPFIIHKRRLGNELRTLGFKPISGSPEEEWVWSGRLCGGRALIEIPKVFDAKHPAKLWIDEKLYRKWRWFRILRKERKFDGDGYGAYYLICVFPHDVMLHGLIVELLQRVKSETGYECPELKGRR